MALCGNGVMSCFVSVNGEMSCGEQSDDQYKVSPYFLNLWIDRNFLGNLEFTNLSYLDLGLGKQKSSKQ